MKTDALKLADWLPPTKPERWKVLHVPAVPVWDEVPPSRSDEGGDTDWKPHPTALKAPVLCQVTGFEGREAVCTVYLEGYELQRVGFPAALLQRKNLAVGHWFGWRMRNAGPVQLSDITPLPAPMADLPPEEVAKLEEKSEAFQRRLVEQGPWPEYTGDGQ